MDLRKAVHDGYTTEYSIFKSSFFQRQFTTSVNLLLSPKMRPSHDPVTQIITAEIQVHQVVCDNLTSAYFEHYCRVRYILAGKFDREKYNHKTRFICGSLSMS